MLNRETLFRWSVSLKGLNALLELVGGIGLLLVTPDFILRAVAFLTQDELAEDPKDFVATTLLHAAQQLSVTTELFMALYLLVHGIVKGLLVVALLRHLLWAYPLSIVVFGLFILYQLYRFTLTHSFGLIALSLFDVVVIAMIWLEYRALRRGARA